MPICNAGPSFHPSQIILNSFQMAVGLDGSRAVGHKSEAWRAMKMEGKEDKSGT